MDTASTRVPRYKDMLWDSVRALRALGGSGHHSEIAAEAIRIGGYSEYQQAVMTPNGRKTKLEYNVQWCLSALKAVGCAENSERGVWALNETGQALGEGDVPALREQVTRYYRSTRKLRRDENNHAVDEAEEPVSQAELGDAWKDELLSILKEMDPLAFEHLCKRLLRESGFTRVTVTKASGDGGIDGVGMLEIGLLTFPTYFQCKRYDTSIGAKVVRDFRGAMAGRGEKGVIITTAAFSRGAREEAARDGVSPIDLVDGDRLCDLLKRVRLGVRVEMVERVTVDADALVEST